MIQPVVSLSSTQSIQKNTQQSWACVILSTLPRQRSILISLTLFALQALNVGVCSSPKRTLTASTFYHTFFIHSNFFQLTHIYFTPSTCSKFLTLFTHQQCLPYEFFFLQLNSKYIKHKQNKFSVIFMNVFMYIVHIHGKCLLFTFTNIFLIQFILQFVCYVKEKVKKKFVEPSQHVTNFKIKSVDTRQG